METSELIEEVCPFVYNDRPRHDISNDNDNDNDNAYDNDNDNAYDYYYDNAYDYY